ncbi:hypothetical protein D3C80_1389000 [compost metagenome]
MHLFASIKLAVTGLLLQLGIMLRSKTPALIVGQVPVKHVELGCRHAVELAQNIRQRQEMTRRIQQHAAPRKTRHVGDTHQRQESVLAVGLHQLQQGFHATQRTETGIGGQGDAILHHQQFIALVAARQRLCRHLVFDVHVNHHACGFCRLRCQRPTGLQFNTLPPALQRITQIVTLQVNRQTVIQHQPARRLGQFHLLRPGHQRQIAGRLRQRTQGKQ